MSKLLYSATMSLDGYIAGPGGDMSWLKDDLEPVGPDIEDLMSQIGALLVGKRTFQGDDPNKGTDEEGAFSGRWHGPSVVLSHHPPPPNLPADVTFAYTLTDAVAAARRAAGDKYVNVLGANLAEQCLTKGVLDEVLVLIAPVLLGDGTPLFRHPGGREVRLEALDPSRTGPTSLWFRVRRDR
jgi:dihydrofolate reductase